ncbi:MAG: ATP-binding protein [Treponemataceae bacterium]|nr:ATP-binding protein [Treponemataceae bacterium]
MKSQWVGETETNLSALFERYAHMCKQAKESNEDIPILLFNEADALFGKRVDSPRNGEISQNQIQSLLLDWIEKQEGILIITTNIPGNFDEAFERRFLFKLKFTKPNLEVKKKIWENKVSWLNKQSIEKLASQYSLSGAEIDNIVRKATMKEVLTGKSTSFEELEAYCKDEKLESNESGPIGFGN